MAQLGDKFFNVNNPSYADAYLEKYKLDNMSNQADFYGKVADDYGASANAREAELNSKNDFSGEGFAKGAGNAISKGGGLEDIAASGLMMSGNPYAMAGGLALQVASAGQKREQAKMEASRKAYLDRNARMREITDKLISMDYGV